MTARIAWSLRCALSLPLATAATAAVRAKRRTRQEFAAINTDTLQYYRGLALSWAVSIDHNYSYLRRALSLNPGRRAAANPDAEPL